MKIIMRFFWIHIVLLLISCQEESPEVYEVVVERGSAAHFYFQGLNTRIPDEKLKFYEQGLEVVTGDKDSMLVALLEGKVYALSLLDREEETLMWTDSLINMAKLQKDTFYIAKGYYRKSRYFALRDQHEQEFEYTYLARQYYLQMGDTAYAARRSLDLAGAQYEMGDYTGSQESATEAIKYLNPATDSIYLSAAHNLIGLTYLDQGFYQDAVKEYETALHFAARKKDSLSFQHNIAIALKNEQKYDDALAILEEIIDSDAPDSYSKSRFLDNYAYTLWLKDSTAQVAPLFFRALKMRQENNDLEGLQTNYGHLAEYYATKDKALAIKYARESLKAARANLSPVLEARSLKLLISLMNGREARTYVDRYMSLTDSLDRVHSRARFHFAKVKFDEQRKQEQIESLEAQNFQQHLEAERLRTGNIISSLSALLVLLLGGALLYYLRQRNKREKIREIYLTESRISKRIHDELANDVYNIMSRLEGVAPTETVDRLEHVYQRTRDISRENSEIDTGENYQAALLSMLSYNTGGARLVIQGEQQTNWERIAVEKKLIIYRVLQELMVNMRKHSEAKLVAISFSDMSKKLVIRYSDTGRGADIADLMQGNGLKNVKNRLASVHGDMTFDTSAKTGLKLTIMLPL
jgi:signal transduction histidine kinase